MNCKNCEHHLEENQNFCPQCGAKVIKERISLKDIWSEFAINVFGWDNTFFRTFRQLIVGPEKLFTEYLNGTRKKYLSPFAFFAIGVAVALLVFNFFQEDFLRISGAVGQEEIQALDQQIVPDIQGLDSAAIKKARVEQVVKAQREMTESVQRTILKYFNFYSFLLLPFYALISFIVFRKPHNYGEHLVMNSYAQGLLFHFTVVLFLMSLLLSPIWYQLAIVVAAVYYMYAFTRLYQLNFKTGLLKFLRFLGILVIVGLLLAMIGALIGFLKYRNSI